MAGTSITNDPGFITDAEGNQYPDTASGREAMKTARAKRIQEAFKAALKNPSFDLETDKVER